MDFTLLPWEKVAVERRTDEVRMAVEKGYPFPTGIMELQINGFVASHLDTQPAAELGDRGKKHITLLTRDRRSRAAGLRKNAI